MEELCYPQNKNTFELKKRFELSEQKEEMSEQTEAAGGQFWSR
jgi:hypothetical protein